MVRSNRARVATAALVVLAISMSLHAAGFVGTAGKAFTVDGSSFYYVGTNNYYLNFKSDFMVDDLLDTAEQMGLTVIRTWAFIDIGALDGSVQHIDGPGHKDSIYYQYWDTEKGAPAYNDGPRGLERLDYVLAEARKRGIYIILTLVNNWPEFGGMDQYNTWFGNQYHHDFYTDNRVKEAYKAYVTHLVERVNTVNAISYKDDPTIFAWELANEPRCRGGRLGATDACGTDMLVDWATEMSAFVKQLDPNHMVAVGDEGFFDIEGNWDYPYSGAEGVDFERLLQIPDIDFGTFHMYPDHWGKDAQWGSQWIRDHAQMADTYDKPVVCEEFGWKNKQNRQDVFTEWIGVMDSVRLAGYNFWMLAAREDNGQRYPDYDGFTVYWGDAEADLFARNAVERATWSASAVRNAVPVSGSATKSPRRLVPFPRAERLRGLELSGCSLQGRHAKQQLTTAPLVLPLMHGEP